MTFSLFWRVLGESSRELHDLFVTMREQSMVGGSSSLEVDVDDSNDRKHKVQNKA